MWSSRDMSRNEFLANILLSFPQVGIVACAFMTSRREEAYREVLDCLKWGLPDLEIPAYMGDFDPAMRGAVEQEFPSTHIYGCFFHYAQCLVRHAKKPVVGLGAEIQQRRGEVYKMFLTFTALPLLPPEYICPAFDFFAEEAILLDERFGRFLRYMKSFWIEHIGPVGMSVYRAPCRTNNAVESNNARFLRNIKVRAPIWDVISEYSQCKVDWCTVEAFMNERRYLFAGEIANMFQDVIPDHLAHSRGVEHIRSRPSRQTKLNNLNITDCWDFLDMGLLSPIDFIRKVKYRVGNGKKIRTKTDDRFF